MTRLRQSPPTNLRRPRATAFVAAVVALALSGCGTTSAFHGGGGAPVRATPLMSIFEADGQLHQDPAGTLDLLRHLGIQTVRVFMPWGTLGSLAGVAPDPASTAPPAGFNGANPGAYPPANWTPYDAIVRDAQARGIQVDLTLGPPPPLWARGPGDPGHPAHPEWRPSAADFGAFVRAVGTRYSGHYVPPGASAPLPAVHFWAVWNEPNFGPMLAPQTLENSRIAVSPSLYRGLLDAAWAALQRTGHGADTILIGELAPRGLSIGEGPGMFRYMVPLRFLRGLYCVNGNYQILRGAAAAAIGCPAGKSATSFPAAHPALFQATGFAVHPYPQGPPNVLTPDEPDYADLPAIPRLESALDRSASAYRSNARLPIYSTEFGYETNPPETVFGTVSPTVAAGYLNLSEYITWRDPRIRSYDQYLLTDPPRGNFATGLEFASGVPKPTYDAYRMPLYLPVVSHAASGPLEVWGCVRPARYASDGGATPPPVWIQFRPSGHGDFVTVQRVALTTRSCYFDVHHAFGGGGAVRLAWSYPRGQTIYSRTMTITG